MYSVNFIKDLAREINSDCVPKIAKTGGFNAVMVYYAMEQQEPLELDLRQYSQTLTTYEYGEVDSRVQFPAIDEFNLAWAVAGTLAFLSRDKDPKVQKFSQEQYLQGLAEGVNSLPDELLNMAIAYNYLINKIQESQVSNR